MPKWILALLILVLSALGVWYFLKGSGTGPQKSNPTTEVNSSVVVEETPAVEERETFKVMLPNGRELEAYKGGIEDRLVQFLKDTSSIIDKTRWFDFDNLNFKLGTAEILPESRPQLENIISILKAFPKAKVKIGGYTDKKGDEPGNLKLSQARADTVYAILSKAGVGNQLAGAEGYGSQFAIYPADSPDSVRVKDRRVSLSVREK